MMFDGLMSRCTSPGYFNNPARGRFNMGWALCPALADLAPSVLRWYFDNSSNAPARDFFVAGPSGTAYLYPACTRRRTLTCTCRS